MSGFRCLRVLALAAFVSLTIAACVPQNQPFIPAQYAAPQQLAKPALPLKLASVDVPTWGPEAFPGKADWIPWFAMNGPDFGTLLDERLRTAGVFSETGEGSATLKAKLLQWRDLSPTAFPPSTYAVDYHYTLTDNAGDVLLDETITSEATDSTFFGQTRMQLAMQYSHYANIDQLISRISSVAGPAYAEKKRNDKTRKAALAKVTAEMTPADDFAVVRADGAVFREFPNLEGTSKGTAELNGTYHVIGRMPDGWALVEKDGVTQGWIYEGSLETLDETQVAALRAEAEAVRAAGAGSYEMAGDIMRPVMVVSEANLMSAPSSQASPYGRLAPGTEVSVLAHTDNGFAYIRQQGVAAGWIDRRALSE